MARICISHDSKGIPTNDSDNVYITVVRGYRHNANTTVSFSESFLSAK